jgi:hypothetical protein
MIIHVFSAWNTGFAERERERLPFWEKEHQVPVGVFEPT